MKISIQFAAILLFSLSFCCNASAEEVLSWQDCVKEAAKNHPDLISAEEVINQSKAAKRITASTLFPQVTSNLNAATAKTTTSSNATSKSSIADTYSYGANGTQLIFDGFKTVNNVNAAKENIKAAQYSYRFTSTEVRLRLRTAFVDLLESQEAIKIAEQIFDIRKRNLDLIRLRYEAGIEHKGALLQAQANLAEAKFEIKQARRDMEVARWQLTKEMGRIKFIAMRVKGSFDVSGFIKEKPDFEMLVKNNPSLQQLIAQKNAAEFSLKSTYANFLPTLSGQAGVGENNSKWPPQNNQWNAGLAISLPIFEGGLRFAQVSQAKAVLNQLRANERSTKDSVVLSLEQTWATLQDAVDNVAVQYKSLIASEERSKIAQAQYSIGYISFDNWTIIEDNLVQAKKSFLNAQANALLAQANWIQAKGETLEYE